MGGGAARSRRLSLVGLQMRLSYLSHVGDIFFKAVRRPTTFWRSFHPTTKSYTLAPSLEAASEPSIWQAASIVHSARNRAISSSSGARS